MNASLEQIGWRAALRDGPDVPGVRAMLRGVVLCLAEPCMASARLLFAAAALRQGFSWQAIAGRAALAEQVGLRETASADDGSRAGRGTVEIAIDDLAGFARAHAAAITDALARGEEANAPDGVRAAGPTDYPAPIEALHALFASPGPGGGDPEAALSAALAAVRASPAVDYRSFHAAPLPLLAAAMAMSAVQDFASANQDVFDLSGAADAAYRMARFDGAGLGPFFTNVGRIASRSGDVFELAGIAHRAGLEVGARVPKLHWVVLLSQHLTGMLRYEVVDDLGDAGAMRALGAILDRAARQPLERREMGLLLRIRDAALDNRDHDLAARAQMLVVRSHPDDPIERLILGSIDGTNGRTHAAEQSLLACLRMNPKDEAATARLQALRAGDFGQFAIDEGFGSPADRRLTRLRRRAGVRSTAPVPHFRAKPVDL